MNASSTFIGVYFAAEKRAIAQPGGSVMFLAADRLTICKMVESLRSHPEMNTNHKLAKILAAHCPKASMKDRHNYRLTKWMGDYVSGKLQREIDKEAKADTIAKTVGSVAKPVTGKPAAAPVDTSATGELIKLKQNLMGTIKSVCKSAIRQNLTQAEINSMLTGGLKEATEEHQVELNTTKFQSFMRANNIDKNTALDILQRI
ncbi:hypothetical protein D3C76_102930 [compost metagenome]